MLADFANELKVDLLEYRSLLEDSSLPLALRRRLNEFYIMMNNFRLRCFAVGCAIRPHLEDLLFELEIYSPERQAAFARGMTYLSADLVEHPLAELIEQCLKMIGVGQELRFELIAAREVSERTRTQGPLVVGNFVLRTSRFCLRLAIAMGVPFTSRGVAAAGVAGLAVWSFLTRFHGRQADQTETDITQLVTRFDEYEELLHSMLAALRVVKNDAAAVERAFQPVMDPNEVEKMRRVLTRLLSDVESLVRSCSTSSRGERLPGM